eukprot:g38315.t1
MIKAILMGVELGNHPLLKILCISKSTWEDTYPKIRGSISLTPEVFPHWEGTPCPVIIARPTPKPSETTIEPEQSTERAVVEQPKKGWNWTPPEGSCSRLDLYAQAIRKHVSARLINCIHKMVQNATQAQLMAIQALKANHNIVIKPADKG